MRICIVGLGYVGLPLAVAFSKHYLVHGIDKNIRRIEELKAGIDSSGELEVCTDLVSKNLDFFSSCAELPHDFYDYYIICVPTPVDEAKQPDLSILCGATREVGGHLKSGCTVVYESTVFPGATEDFCVPLLTEMSGLIFNRDFFVGYSPERVNPGKGGKKLSEIVKVVSASSISALNKMEDLYGTIISEGIFRAKSIRVAEAAKVIENVQRDVNIALMNQLDNLFYRLGLDTYEVLETARTKWNFLDFRPGFVGGHCIGVDPYYLSYVGKLNNFHLDLVDQSRRINDDYSSVVASRVVSRLFKISPKASPTVLVLGFTFKENCPDTRNTKILDLLFALNRYGVNVVVSDPWVPECDRPSLPNVSFCNYEDISESSPDAIVIAVAHDEFRSLTKDGLADMVANKDLIFDLKNIFRSK